MSSLYVEYFLQYFSIVSRFGTLVGLIHITAEKQTSYAACFASVGAIIYSCKLFQTVFKLFKLDSDILTS